MAEKNGAASRKSRIIAEVTALCRKPVEDAGYLLWDVDFFKEGADFNLLVSIDKKERGEPIGLDDCETVSRLLNPLLDQADPIEESYFLEVSSAGIERRLKTEEHFRLYLGKKVRIGLFSPIGGAKTISGTLLSCENKNITVQTSKGKLFLENGKYSKVMTAEEEK